MKKENIHFHKSFKEKKMKIIISLITCIILILQFGCKQATEPTSQYVYVSYEIESAFQNDLVKLVLDDKILLESRITTNYVLSLAWSSGLQKISKDDHILHFTMVEYGTEKDYRIDTTNDTSTVLMRFDKNTNQISIKQIKGRTLRD